MKVNLLPGYDVRKAAQVAAFFAIKAGGKINKLRLVKLIYLADRQFMIRYDEPMLQRRRILDGLWPGGLDHTQLPKRRPSAI